MERYTEYKDSGVAWIGDIPAHWEPCRNKDLFQECKDAVGDKSSGYTLLSLTKQGVIIRDLSENKGKFPKEFGTYKIVNKGDMIFCLFDVDETPRTVGLSANEGMITGAYNIFKIKRATPAYLLYYYMSLDDKKALKPLYKGLRKVIPLSSFMSARIYLPAEYEQQNIASYLDSQLTKIRHYERERERELTLLETLKKTEIAQVVTKGLNPDVPMRDSGIPWIGEIPAHWEVKNLRHFLRFVSIKGHGDKQLLSVTREQGVIKRNVDSKEENHNFIPDDLSGYKLVREGQFVINKMKSWQGSYGVSEYTGIASPAYFVCELDFPCKAFFSWAIRCKAYVPFFTQYSKGIRVDQWDLSPIALKVIPFFVPPIEEQQAIVDYIEERIAQIDAYIAAITEELELLRQYKQRLISDAVTGKIKVPTPDATMP